MKLIIVIFLLFAHCLFAQSQGGNIQPPGSGGASAIACVGTPGNTLGSYRQQCQTSAGALYVCNNAAGCTVSADWVAVGGSSVSITSANGGLTLSPSPLTGTGTADLTNEAATAHQFYNSVVSGLLHSTQPGFSDLSGQATNAQLATQTANTVLGALTATTPGGLALPSCSASGNALNWTSGTGFGCVTGLGSGNVTGPGSSTTGDLPSFSDTTGKVIGDSGVAAANVPLLNAANVFSNSLNTFSASNAFIVVNQNGGVLQSGLQLNRSGTKNWTVEENQSNGNFEIGNFPGGSYSSQPLVITNAGIVQLLSTTIIGTAKFTTPNILGASTAPTVAISGTGTCTLGTPSTGANNILGRIPVTGACTSATLTITYSGTPGYTNGSNCGPVQDITSGQISPMVTGTTTAATFSLVTVANSDVLAYNSCMGY